jgi:two-component sensor histidine kinase
MLERRRFSVRNGEYLERLDQRAREVHSRRLQQADGAAAARLPVAPPQPGVLFYRLDRRFRFVAANAAALRAWGFTRDQIIGRTVPEVFPQAEGSDSWAQQLAVAHSRHAARLETISPVLHCWVDLAVHPDRGGGLSVSFRDVSDRRQRETSVAEISHRLANDMQFVLSQIELARRHGRSATVALDRAIERAAFSSRLQRHLLGPPDEILEVAPLLVDIVNQALGAFAEVQSRLEIAPVALPRRRVMPLVLLAWEAATNAAKHVFAPRLGSHFELRLAGDDAPGMLRLTIGDDGPGLPAVPTQGTDRHGMGHGIMHELAAQLGATLEVAPGPGARLHLRFPIISKVQPIL